MRILFKARIKNMGTSTQSQMLQALRIPLRRFQEVNHYISSKETVIPGIQCHELVFRQQLHYSSWKGKKKRQKTKQKDFHQCLLSIWSSLELSKRDSAGIQWQPPDNNNFWTACCWVPMNLKVGASQSTFIMWKVMANF